MKSAYTQMLSYGLIVLMALVTPVTSAGQFIDRNAELTYMGEFGAEADLATLDKRISAEFDDQSILEAIEYIAHQVDLTLNYNPELISSDMTVSKSFQDRSAKEVLSELFDEMGLNYLVSKSGHLVVAPETITGFDLFEQATGDVSISGSVTDSETNESLIGVSIWVRGSEERGTASGMDGTFELNVPSLQDTLVFSYVGYERTEVPLDGRSELDVQMVSHVIAGEEIVVIGYGERERGSITGSVSRVGGEDIRQQASTLTSAALMGKTPGVTVTQTSGQPGRNHGNIQIRGIGTLSNSDALVLIDGVEGNMDHLSPADIEDISILKDASAAAIYGSRAANGVIKITTRRGRADDDFHVNYRGLYGVNTPTNLPTYVDAGTFMELENEGATNLGGNPVWDEEFIQAWYENHESDPDNYPNTDWVDKLFTGSGLQQTQELMVSGGRDDFRYMGSLNYDEEQGTIPNFGYQRYSFRLNTDVFLRDNLDFDFDLSAIRIDRQRSSSSLALLTNQAFRVPPIYPAVHTNGNWGEGWAGGGGRNPVALAEDGGIRNDEEYRLRGRINARYEPVTGLEFNMMYAPQLDNTFYKRMRKQIRFHPFSPEVDFDPDGSMLEGPRDTNDLLQGEARNFTHNFNVRANLHRDFQNHNIELLGGYELIDYQRRVFDAYRDNFVLQNYEELNAGSAANAENSGRSTAYNLQSFFGRVNYEYASRYLVEFNLRYDGSSRFVADNRWGLFPSFSVGWDFSEESFMQGVDWLSSSMLRAAYGMLGNQEIAGNFPYASVINLDQDVVFGGTRADGAAQLDAANPNLTWEETTTLNLGADLGFWDDRVDFSFEWFKNRTEDILLELPIPNIVGLNEPYQNAGVVENTGWEFSAGYGSSIGNELYLGLGFNLSDVKNEVVDLHGTGPYIIGNTIIKEGHPINSLYGYKADGLFTSQEEIDEHANQFGTLAPGDIKYQDLDGSGIISDDTDRTIIGDPNPGLTYGLDIDLFYRNFEISALIQGYGERDVLLTGHSVWALYHAGKVTEWQAESYWSEDNPDATYPRLTQTGDHNNFRASSFWVYDASYVRLRNLEVAYNIPARLTEQFSLRNARIFFTGHNLLTLFDDMPDGIDPNAPNHTSGSFYPINRVLSGGIEVGF